MDKVDCLLCMMKLEKFLRDPKEKLLSHIARNAEVWYNEGWAFEGMDEKMDELSKAKAPGRTLVLVVAILGTVGLVASVFIYGLYVIDIINVMSSGIVLHQWDMFYMIFTPIGIIFQTFAVIMCYKHCNNVEKGDFLLKLGTIWIVLTGIGGLADSLATEEGFSFISGARFLLPILLMTGATKNKAIRDQQNRQNLH